MKALMICISIHHGNTERIARSIAETLEAKLLRPHEIDVDTLSEYDLIGFGSGIYFWKHHKALLNLAHNLPKLNNKKTFIFSTRGIGPTWLYHRPLRKRLLEKGFDIIGEFSCRGLDTVGSFKLIGGINKGRPNKEDLEKAEDFGRYLKDRQT